VGISALQRPYRGYDIVEAAVEAASNGNREPSMQATEYVEDFVNHQSRAINHEVSHAPEYGPPSGDPNLGDESTRDPKALSNHISQNWGGPMVYREIVSEYVPIDHHVVPPSDDLPFYNIITTGISRTLAAFPLRPGL
jgi:hypothetical protein